MEQSVLERYQAEGKAGLESIPYIGSRLSSLIEEVATTGELQLLQRLLIDVSPEDLFTTIPGIGQLLARRIYRGLGIHSLEALEQAAYDGTLSQVEGFGQSRLQLVRDALTVRLNRSTRPREKVSHQVVPRKRETTVQHLSAPSTELLLEVDRQYRELANAGQLRRVTPRRFNPEGKRWLPVMRLKKEGWAFNALYSNTARAHELKKTDDWVVIYYEREGLKGQCTIVTETHGAQKGNRVVRSSAIAA